MSVRRRWAALLLLPVLAGAVPAAAQDQRPQLAPISPDCRAPGVDAGSSSNFPNIVKAMVERRKIVALAIGGSSVGGRGYRSGDYFALVEAFLERTFRGLDVEIVQRGVSGELARDAAERIRLETARVEPDVIFWQVGTADALAGIDPVEIGDTVRDTIHWLRDHHVDTVLIGLHYSRAVARDVNYQAVRTVLDDVAKSENVLKISRYEVVETLARIQQSGDDPPSEGELTASSYDCMAEYLARSLATGIFGRQKSVPQPIIPTPRR